MAPDDCCRLCKVNMREGGPSMYGHSTDMFSTKKTMSISDKLALLGLIIAQESGRSNRCCQRCSLTINRLERDLPVFRKWEEDLKQSTAFERPREPTPSKNPTAPEKSCPNPPTPSASFPGNVTTQVTIKYPSQTMTRKCDPEVDPIIKFIALRRWKEAASHALKHQHLREELKHGVINLIRTECEVLCSPKNDFILWKSTPADLKSFSFNKLRDDFHRLAPFLLSVFNCISNDNTFAGCTAAAIAIRGRQPRLAAFSYWVNTILQYGGARKSVFNRLSHLSITTSHSKAIKKQQELALACGDEFLQFRSGLNAADTELLEASQSLEDLQPSDRMNSSAQCSMVIPTLGGYSGPDQVSTLVRQEGDPPFNLLSPSIAVISEENISKSTLLHPDRAEENTQDLVGEWCEGEEPGCSIDLYLDNEQNDNSFDTDDSEEWSFVSQTTTNDADNSRNTAEATVKSDESFNSTMLGNDGKHGDELHRCGECFKTFQNKETLERHVLIHARQFLFTCEICSKGFSRKSYYKQHLKVHADTRPYSCSICQRGFLLKGHLEAHMRIHTGEKPFSCSDCGRRFRQRSARERHVLSRHSSGAPYVCPVCQKGFIQKYYFRIHMRLHAGNRPFRCSVCGNSYMAKGLLRKHMALHEASGEIERVKLQ